MIVIVALLVALVAGWLVSFQARRNAERAMARRRSMAAHPAGKRCSGVRLDKA